MAQRDWVEWHRDYAFMSVGAHRLIGEPTVLTPGRRLFTFEAAGA